MNCSELITFKTKLAAYLGICAHEEVAKESIPKPKFQLHTWKYSSSHVEIVFSIQGFHIFNAFCVEAQSRGINVQKSDNAASCSCAFIPIQSDRLEGSFVCLLQKGIAQAKPAGLLAQLFDYSVSATCSSIQCKSKNAEQAFQGGFFSFLRAGLRPPSTWKMYAKCSFSPGDAQASSSSYSTYWKRKEETAKKDAWRKEKWWARVAPLSFLPYFHFCSILLFLFQSREEEKQWRRIDRWRWSHTASLLPHRTTSVNLFNRHILTFPHPSGSCLRSKNETFENVAESIKW